MCAINGLSFEDASLISKMNAVTAHRGPDHTGSWVNQGVSLGHNRLSILDLSPGAHQPMLSQDGALAITFNGEIYNYQSLREELRGTYSFKTESDTEVILAAYQAWGARVFQRLNGIFALAIWDSKKKSMILARDILGVKPLFYTVQNGRLAFSSEIKAILESGIQRKLNRTAMGHYFRVLYVPQPLTCFENISKLPPGCYAEFHNSEISIRPYWEPNSTPVIHSNAYDLSRQVRETVEQAVGRQLVSDRPVGVYLSGGIDSSTVLDCVSQFQKKIQTFSVGFEVNGRIDEEKFNSDVNLAKRTAEFYGTNHQEIRLLADEVPELLEKAIWHLDEPNSEATSLPLLKLASVASKEVVVTLTGAGGDELFGGYQRYQTSLLWSAYLKLPAPLRASLKWNARARKADLKSDAERYALFHCVKEKALARFLKPEALKNETLDWIAGEFRKAHLEHFEERMMLVDRQTWLADHALAIEDKMSSAFGLEARVPLLDKEVIALADRIPLKSKMPRFQKKALLRMAFRDSLPGFLFEQPKRGFFSPGSSWIRHPQLNPFFREILSEEFYSPTRSIFNFSELKKMVDEHCEKQDYHFTTLWSVLTFQLWAKRFQVETF